MNAINRTMGRSEWTMLIVLSVLWGGSFFFIGVAVKELPPFTIVALRVTLAALVLHAVARIMGLGIGRDRATWAAFFGMGLLNNVIPFCLIVWGQSHIPSGLAAILNATAPLSGVIVAHFLTDDEKMTGNRLIGVVIGMAGATVMVGPDAMAGLGTNLLAQLAILGATLSYAFSGVFGRRFKRMGLAPLATATGQLTASSVMMLPLSLAIDQPWTLAMPGPATLGAIAGLVLLSTTLAYVLFFRILASAGATNLALVTFLIPVSAVLLGWLVLGERLEAKHLLGMAIISLGLAAIDGRLLDRARAALSGSGASGR